MARPIPEAPPVTSARRPASALDASKPGICGAYLAREDRLVVLQYGAIPRRAQIGAVALELLRIAEQCDERAVVQGPCGGQAVAADVRPVPVRSLRRRKQGARVVLL